MNANLLKLAEVFSLVVVIAGCGIASSSALLRIADDVNHAQRDQSFDNTGWYAAKYFRLFREHRRIFPDSKLRRKAYVLNALGIASVVTLGAVAGIFR
jgi:hypothetical protein